jgi:hypothetical protein
MVLFRNSFLLFNVTLSKDFIFFDLRSNTDVPCLGWLDDSLSPQNPQIYSMYVGFGVFKDVFVKRNILWDIKCSLLKICRLFRATYRFHLEGKIIMDPIPYF